MPEQKRPEQQQPAPKPPAAGPKRSRPDDPPAVPPLRRLARSMIRPGKAQVIAAVMLFLVGLGAVMQVRANSSDDAYRNLNREQLFTLLDGLGERSKQYEAEIADLERKRVELTSGADKDRSARAQLEQQLEGFSILAGTAPAQGPGIRMTIQDPQNKVDGDVLLSAVEELRDAGAEVIEINNSVRVVASTWFAGSGDQLVTDGQPISRPITISVIGDPHSLEEAARFRGGIVSEITGPQIGGTVDINQLDRLVISSLHRAEPNQYARPASGPPTPR